MSRFGRSGPPEVCDTFSLLVLSVSFRTKSDDLFPLFDRYGEVVYIYIPRDRRTGDSRGFAFVRYKYEDEVQEAVYQLDGRKVDGREIMVQFAKYGPNAERIHKGRITEEIPKPRGCSRSCSPSKRYHYAYRDRSQSRSRERYERDSLSPAHRSPSHSRGHSPRRTPSREGTPSRPRDDRSPRSRGPSA